MLCPRCYGKHFVTMSGARVPCPECAGVGELHCCDGLREQDCAAAPDGPKFPPTSSKSKAEEPAARN
ncbi:MAG: hypothetical protein FJ304_01050 [Planctomycetes bacterium]|nr:hypothetical protein [Planctomycetota bacterium]